MFSTKTPRQKEGKQLLHFDHQNINSLRSRHHCVNSSVLVLCFHRVLVEFY